MKTTGTKKHAKTEMAALKKGGASKAVMAKERAEYGMKKGGKVGAFKPCAGCPSPAKCKAKGMCMGGKVGK